ncbi:MAG: phosphoribosylamine--glycine ligase, partial [Pseudomonadota bacterium]
AAVFDALAPALAHVEASGGPQVVKADGLAAGKGVVVAATAQEAADAVRACFSGGFGAAGARVVIEERLVGPEVSLFALADGNTVRRLATARDYKRAYDGDNGPNTGGMGAVSPAPGFGEADADAAMATIVEPVLAHLKAEGVTYRGVLYAGLMLTEEGPKLIEFNVRFGDPECQAILPRLHSDPFSLMLAVAEGRLAEAPIALCDDSAVAVVVAADGYPGPARKGEVIGGLDTVAAHGATLYHAATKATDAGITANGGRVLAAVSLGQDAAAARTKVYAALQHLDLPGGRYRRDIAA